MSKIEYDGFGRQVEIQAENDLDINSAEILEFEIRLSKLETRIDFSLIEMNKIGDIGGFPAYEFELTCSENRVWKHEIVFKSPNNPSVSTDASDLWDLAEIDVIRPFLFAIETLISKFQTTKIEVIMV